MRRTRTVTIPGEPAEELGKRDNGKTFLLTEMSSERAEKWAARLLVAMTRNGVEVDPVLMQENAWAAILSTNVLNGLAAVDWPEAEALLDEMWGCIQIVEEAVTRIPTPDDIEEIQTRARLRREVIELHTGFSLSAAFFMLVALLAEKGESSTPTSHPLLEPSSIAERPH